MSEFFKRNKKSIVAVGSAALSFAVLVLTSEPAAISGGEVATGLIMLGGAVGVYRVTNTA